MAIILIISLIIQNSEKMKLTDQNKNVIIDNLSGLFGKIYMKKKVRKVITNWQKNPKKVHKMEKYRPGLSNTLVLGSRKNLQFNISKSKMIHIHEYHLSKISTWQIYSIRSDIKNV